MSDREETIIVPQNDWELGDRLQRDGAVWRVEQIERIRANGKLLDGCRLTVRWLYDTDS